MRLHGKSLEKEELGKMSEPLIFTDYWITLILGWGTRYSHLWNHISAVQNKVNIGEVLPFSL